MSPLLALAFTLLACSGDRDTSTPHVVAAVPPVDAAQYSKPYWNVRVGTVRTELKKVTKALDENDAREARSAWMHAYRAGFEPLIEETAKSRMDPKELMRLEYLFGRLGAALEKEDANASRLLLGEVEARLLELPDKLAVEAPTSSSAAQGASDAPREPEGPRPAATTDVPALAPKR